uniref:Uncharacterized protein n=1 Tax=Tetranychus urticae TaxID=32264 RepID=T1JTY0_TETUR
MIFLLHSLRRAYFNLHNRPLEL